MHNGSYFWNFLMLMKVSWILVITFWRKYSSYILSPWVFLSGVGPLWFPIGCFVNKINKFLSLVVHARRYCLTHFTTSWDAKMSLTFNELIWNVLDWTSTLLLSMHWNLLKMDGVLRKIANPWPEVLLSWRLTLLWWKHMRNQSKLISTRAQSCWIEFANFQKCNQYIHSFGSGTEWIVGWQTWCDQKFRTHLIS